MASITAQSRNPRAIKMSVEKVNQPKPKSYADDACSVSRARAAISNRPEPAPIKLVSRKEYDAVKKKLASAEDLVTEQLNRVRELRSSVDVDAATRKNKRASKQFAEGKIDASTLKARNAEYSATMVEASGIVEACSLIDEKIESLREEADETRQEVLALAERIKIQHLDTLLEGLPLEKIQEAVIWSRYLSGHPKKPAELFGVPTNELLVNPIRERTLKELDL